MCAMANEKTDRMKAVVRGGLCGLVSLVALGLVAGGGTQTPFPAWHALEQALDLGWRILADSFARGEVGIPSKLADRFWPEGAP